MKTCRLTPSQTKILQHVANGLNLIEAAAEMGRSPKTLEQHMRYARGRLGARNTAHAVALAIRSNLI